MAPWHHGTMAPWHHSISEILRPRDTATMRPVSAGATGLGKKGMAKTFAETVASRLLLGQIFYWLYFNYGGLTPVNTITGGFMWFL